MNLSSSTMFHVPEHARVTHGELGSTVLAGPHGAFVVPSPEPGWSLVMIATDGTVGEAYARDWEHVSVHARRGGLYTLSKVRTPSWREMCVVKGLFWDADDVVMQLHPRASVYVNCHPHVLHLWRHRTLPIPEPDARLVGPQGAQR